MVLLRLTVKVLPREPVPTAATTSKHDGDGDEVHDAPDAVEKITSFLLIVRSPEQVTLGQLSWMITEKWAKLRPDAGPLEIKKLLDDDYADDDLDADLTVADVFVDSGKALTDGLDQRAVVRVVQKPSESRIRYGSVVQDWNAAASRYASVNATRQHLLHAVPEIAESGQLAVLNDDDAMQLDHPDGPHDEMSPLLTADAEPEQHQTTTTTTTTTPPTTTVEKRQRREQRGNQGLLAPSLAAGVNSPRNEESTATAGAARRVASRWKTSSLVDRFTGDGDGEDLGPSVPNSSSHAQKRRWSAVNPTADGDNDGGEKQLDGEQTGTAGGEPGRAKRQNTTQKDPKRLRACGSNGADIHNIQTTTVGDKTSGDPTAAKTTAPTATTHQGSTRSRHSSDMDEIEKIAMEVAMTPTCRDTVRRREEHIRRFRAEAAAQGQDEQQAPVEQNEERDTGALADTTLARKATPDGSCVSQRLQSSSPKTNNNDRHTASQEASAPNGPDLEVKRRTTRADAHTASEGEPNPDERNGAATRTTAATFTSATAAATTAAIDAPKIGVNSSKLGQTGPDNTATPSSTTTRPQAKTPRQDASQLKRKENTSSPTPSSVPRSKRRVTAPSPELSGDPCPSGTGSSKNDTAAATATAAKGGHSEDVPNKPEAKTPATNPGPVDVQEVIASSKSSFPPNVTKKWIAACQAEQDWEYDIKVAKEQGKSSKEIGLMNTVLVQLKRYNLTKRTCKKYEARRDRKRLNQAKQELANIRDGDGADSKHGDADKKTKTSLEEKKKTSPEETKNKKADSEKPSGAQQPRALRQSVLGTVEPTGTNSSTKSATPKSVPYPIVCVPPLESVWPPSAVRMARSKSRSAAKTDKNTKTGKQQQDTAASSERTSIANRGLVRFSSDPEPEPESDHESKLDKTPVTSNVAAKDSKKESATQRPQKKSSQLTEGEKKIDHDVVVLSDDQSNTRQEAAAETSTGKKKKKYPGLPSLPSDSAYEVNEVSSDSDASVLLREARINNEASRIPSGSSNARAGAAAATPVLQRGATRTSYSGPASSPPMGQCQKKEKGPVSSSWDPAASLNVLGLSSPPTDGTGNRKSTLKTLQDNFPGFKRLTRS